MTEQRQPGTGRIWTPRAKLPPCPICEKDELHVARWSASYKIKCLSCGWDSGIQACHDDSLVDNLIIQLVAITTAGYNAISAQLLNKSMLDTQPRQLTPQQRMVVRLMRRAVSLPARAAGPRGACVSHGAGVGGVMSKDPHARQAEEEAIDWLYCCLASAVYATLVLLACLLVP